VSCYHTEGAGHDCAYVDARNALLPIAAKLASLRTGVLEVRSEQENASWDRAFLLAMDELWAQQSTAPATNVFPQEETRA
jgi:hypothetical protein